MVADTIETWHHGSVEATASQNTGVAISTSRIESAKFDSVRQVTSVCGEHDVCYNEKLLLEIRKYFFSVVMSHNCYNKSIN